MSLQDLFTASQAVVAQAFSWNAIYRCAPDKSRTELVNAVFHDLTDSEVQFTPAAKSMPRLGVIDFVAVGQSITDQDEFEIGGEIWKFRGDGGTDGAFKSVLIVQPKVLRQSSSRR